MKWPGLAPAAGPAAGEQGVGSLVQCVKERGVRVAVQAHFSPHCLRHTFASLLLQDGTSPAYVQEAFGHSSIKLTVDTYGRWLRKRAPAGAY